MVETRDKLRERLRRQAREFAENPRYFIYRCPVCLRQHPGPRGHRMAGDDLCQGIGSDGWHQAHLEIVEVAVVESGPKAQEGDGG